MNLSFRFAEGTNLILGLQQGSEKCQRYQTGNACQGCLWKPIHGTRQSTHIANHCVQCLPVLIHNE